VGRSAQGKDPSLAQTNSANRHGALTGATNGNSH
jgi:hypothetical protein